MNEKQANKIHKLASHVARTSVGLINYEDEATGKTRAYSVSVDQRIFSGMEDFYIAYPECHSPYSVKHSGDKWTLVFVEDEDEGRERPVDGEPTYDHRQNAYIRRKVLNAWWQARQIATYR